MFRRTAWLGAVLAMQLAGCRATPHTVSTQAQAIAVAKSVLAGQPGAAGPFDATYYQGTWTVTANTGPRSSTSVAILARNGMTSTFTSDLPDPALPVPGP
jgi:hypothetical protein